MAKSLYVGINGAARKAIKIYVGINGSAHKVKAGFVGVNGVARQFYMSEASRVSSVSVYRVCQVYAHLHNNICLTHDGILQIDFNNRTYSTLVSNLSPSGEDGKITQRSVASATQYTCTSGNDIYACQYTGGSSTSLGWIRAGDLGNARGDNAGFCPISSTRGVAFIQPKRYEYYAKLIMCSINGVTISKISESAATAPFYDYMTMVKYIPEISAIFIVYPYNNQTGGKNHIDLLRYNISGDTITENARIALDNNTNNSGYNTNAPVIYKDNNFLLVPYVYKGGIGYSHGYYIACVDLSNNTVKTTYFGSADVTSGQDINGVGISLIKHNNDTLCVTPGKIGLITVDGAGAAQYVSNSTVSDASIKATRDQTVITTSATTGVICNRIYPSTDQTEYEWIYYSLA